jgi:hypothetical protein
LLFAPRAIANLKGTAGAHPKPPQRVTLRPRRRGVDIAKIRHRLCPSERGITGRDLREPLLHHRRDERAVAREHVAACDRTAARARRHVLRVEQLLVDAERSMKPHAVAEARLLHFRADPRHAVRIKVRLVAARWLRWRKQRGYDS